jgi:hypothetical protein
LGRRRNGLDGKSGLGSRERMSMRFGVLHRGVRGKDERSGDQRKGVMGRWGGSRRGGIRLVLMGLMMVLVMAGSEKYSLSMARKGFKGI